MTPQESLILIVEDDDNDVVLLRRAFRKAAIANPIAVVGDGEAAVAYLEGRGAYADRAQHPMPALVLLDLKLPRRSGFEVLAWVQTQPGLKRLPIVVLTSSRQSGDVGQAYDLGANSYLVKPVEFDSLREMVRVLNLYWIVYNERPVVPGMP